MAAVQKRFYVALDIKRPTANRDFEVVEGDNGNILEIELTDDGAAVDLSGCRVLAVFSKSDGAAQRDTDGHGVEVDAEQTNKLTIALYTTSVAPGLVECELQVYSGEGYATLATTAKFNFMCRRGIANEDVLQATEEWPILVDTLHRCEAVEDAEAERILVEAARVQQEETRQTAEEARELYADKWRNMSLAVSKLDFSEQPTAAITEEETRFSVSLGIPQGEPGSVTSHVHGNITNDGRIGTTENLPVFTGEGGVLETASAADFRAAIEAAKKATAEVTLPSASWMPISGGMILPVLRNSYNPETEMLSIAADSLPVLSVAGDSAFMVFKLEDTIPSGGISSIAVNDISKNIAYGGETFDGANAGDVLVVAYILLAEEMYAYFDGLVEFNVDLDNTPPFFCAVEVPGLLESMAVNAGAVYSDIYATALTEKAEAAKIDAIFNQDGLLVAVAFEEKPAADITLKLNTLE